MLLKKKKKKKCNRMTSREEKGVEPSGGVSFLVSSQVKDSSFHTGESRVATLIKGKEEAYPLPPS